MPDTSDEDRQLDQICAHYTAFPTFAALLAANKERGYVPTLRLDLMSLDGLLLVDAFNHRAMDKAYVTELRGHRHVVVSEAEIKQRAARVRRDYPDPEKLKNS